MRTNEVGECREDGKGDEETDDSCAFPCASGRKGLAEMKPRVVARAGASNIVAHGDGRRIAQVVPAEKKGHWKCSKIMNKNLNMVYHKY